MRVLAVIPARGGSKGIPNKNILPIGGRPLLGRTIRAVRSCPLVSDILVTTDSPAIAELARQYGAEVVERPPASGRRSGQLGSGPAACLCGLGAACRIVLRFAVAAAEYQSFPRWRRHGEDHHA